jgi:hypothetical protein
MMSVHYVDFYVDRLWTTIIVHTTNMWLMVDEVCFIVLEMVGGL